MVFLILISFFLLNLNSDTLIAQYPDSPPTKSVLFTAHEVIDMVNALESDNEKTVQAFLDRGFDVNNPIQNYCVPLLAAVSTSSRKTCDLILKHPQFKGITFSKDAILWQAAKYGFEDIVFKCLRAGANINVKEYESKTPLLLAIENGHRKVCFAILQEARATGKLLEVLSEKNADGKRAHDINPEMMNECLDLIEMKIHHSSILRYRDPMGEMRIGTHFLLKRIY